MQNDVAGAPPPPPPPSVMQEEQTVKGDIQNGATDSLTETVLSMIERVLTLALL